MAKMGPRAVLYPTFILRWLPDCRFGSLAKEADIAMD
jgi:hypothetical protein